MNMFGNKSGGSKKPVVRRETVKVAIKPSGVSKPVPAAVSTQKPAARPRDPNRFKLSQTTTLKASSASASASASPAPVARPPKTVEKRALAPLRGIKRKSASATPTPMFSDESEDDSSDLGASDSDASRKRIKSSVSSLSSESSPRRNIILRDAFSGSRKDVTFIHGADATSGEHEAKYKNPWDFSSYETVELQYPCKMQRERFQLKWPRNEADDYKPMEDIIETVQTIVSYYFPTDLATQYSDDSTGFKRRFNRAWQRQSIPDFVQLVTEFNGVLTPMIEDGTIQRELSKQTGLRLEWIQRILDQVYSRTVSPKVETLRVYQNGGDNVYGEILPRFASEIFRKTHLKQDQVFIDLGSGVGNVVLQAALEIGCESWGIESMKNPCELAALQAKEFRARSQLWGLDAGEVHLLDGDMTEHPDVSKILQRADVVLVNNQAFTPQLNDKLTTMFLDLKDGARVVSLKPFVPDHHKITMRNLDSVVNQFTQQRFQYFSESVSWSYWGNEHWYIATKDPSELNDFRRRNGF